jgi:hypothetical protein
MEATKKRVQVYSAAQKQARRVRKYAALRRTMSAAKFDVDVFIPALRECLGLEPQLDQHARVMGGRLRASSRQG